MWASRHPGRLTSVRRAASALGLSLLPGGKLPGSASVLPGLLGQRPALVGDGLMHPCDLVLDPGDLLGRVRHQLPEGLAAGSCLRGARGRLGSAAVLPHRA
jgi:hypothetical protein